MCRHCRHHDLDQIEKRVESRFGLRPEFTRGSHFDPPVRAKLDPVYLREVLQPIENRLRELRDLRKDAQRRGESTYALDYEHDLLRFAAWVLNENRHSADGWLNGGIIFVA
jgi:hypothetical protein